MLRSPAVGVSDTAHYVKKLTDDTFDGYITIKRFEDIQEIKYRHMTRRFADGVESFLNDLGGEADYSPKELNSSEAFGILIALSSMSESMTLYMLGDRTHLQTCKQVKIIAG